MKSLNSNYQIFNPESFQDKSSNYQIFKLSNFNCSKPETKQKSYPSKKTFIFRKVALYKYKE